LEHGGAAPVIVNKDADLDAVVPALAKGGFYHSGQICVSVQRVYADRAIADTLAQRLAEAGGSMHVGDPLDADTEVGPLIRPAEVERVHGWVTEALEGGAACLTDGQPLSATCYPPTVLLDPSDGARISREEIFGPVICVYPYEDVDEAFRRANGLRVAFQAAVFSRDIDFASGAASRLAAAAVMINDHTAFRVDWMPFAGLEESGLGVGGIPYTFRDTQIEKLIVMHSARL
jgi:acyl-CoA reductase-like NAD-dependent aldehyde dehydrogenase